MRMTQQQQRNKQPVTTEQDRKKLIFTAKSWQAVSETKQTLGINNIKCLLNSRE
jgi:hypothetical protein